MEYAKRVEELEAEGLTTSDAQAVADAEEMQESRAGYRATYSPDDNKLRLYSDSRLDAATYARARELGFIFAPKQGLFVAPMWTPSREDFLIKLAGEIGDEDTSLTARAEERAERFDEYSDKRANDAERAHSGVAAIAENIPFGQPILIGHHSERRARKDKERIENGMRKAVKMWETSAYWEQRAAGALAHAKYKELPQVRARRIKKIETDKRRNEKETAQANTFIKMWTSTEKELTLERAKNIAGYSHVSKCFTLAEYPRPAEASQYEGMMSIYSALDDGIITPEQAREICLRAYQNGNEWRARWLAHYNNRLTYEKAMLNEQGRSDLIAPKARPKQLPICNYKQESFTIAHRWTRGEMETLKQVEMTSAEYMAVHEDQRGTRIVENSHRIRIAILSFNDDGTLRKYAGYQGKAYAIFLTDSKTHKKPEPVESAPKQAPLFAPRAEHQPDPVADKRRAKLEAARDVLEQGVQVVAAPQLFPTPQELARRMVDALGGVCGVAGKRVLEPSAGTGNLIRAIYGAATGADCVRIVAIEVNNGLVKVLQEQRSKTLNANEKNFEIHQADFMTCGEELGKFDCVIMNPPFVNQQDIDHVTHALTFLKEGGRLVAIMSAGVIFRQDRKATTFRALIDGMGGTIEELPDDSFKEYGTSVRTVLVEVGA